MEFEQLVAAIEDRMELDVCVMDGDSFPVADLAGYDPQEVVRELAKRNPWSSYAWEELDGSDFIGRIHYGGYGGEIPMCRCCLAPGDLWWTDMVHDAGECKKKDRRIARLDGWLMPAAETKKVDDLSALFGALSFGGAQSMEVD